MDREEVFRRLVAVGWTYYGGVYHAPNGSFWLSHALIAPMDSKRLLELLRERQARVLRGELDGVIEDWWEPDFIDDILEKEHRDVAGALEALEGYLLSVPE